MCEGTTVSEVVAAAISPVESHSSSSCALSLPRSTSPPPPPCRRTLSTKYQYRTRVVESAIRKSNKVIKKNMAQVVWRGSLVWDLELLFLPIPIQNDDKKDLPK